MAKSNSIILVMSQNLSESGGRRLMDLSLTRAASSEEKPVCGCRSKRVDQPCIMKSIRKWDGKNNFCFCSLCFLGKEEKTVDERIEYLISGNPVSKESPLQFLNDGVYRVLTNPKNVDELFNLYVNTHPGAEHFKPEFEYGLRFLMGKNMAELREELFTKERSDDSEKEEGDWLME